VIRVAVAHLGMDRTTNSPVVILREVGGERTLPIWIGPGEAHAIAMEMQGVHPQRPLTHDLLKHVLGGLGAALRRVNLTGIRDGTYYAELLLARGETIFEVDARPSDSIALALRCNAPIFSAEALFDRADDGPADAPAPESGPTSDALRRYLEKLDPQDFGRFQP
jgi:bifunctional DNase/RNase